MSGYRVEAGVRRWVGALLFPACIVVSALALYNVFSDNVEVVQQARVVAECPGGICGLTRMDRTVLAQTFEFTGPTKKVTVRCARGFVLVGEYECRNVP